MCEEARVYFFSGDIRLLRRDRADATPQLRP